ncbi:MAG: hypothetical protein K9H26_08135 [Prolixibacteraceae bacterium]|nr:hypothetical protein [Prolixibacteraceae bacterium]
MKKNSRGLSIALIAMGLIVGFLTGISIDFPKTDTGDLKGTIGKVNKHRNVTITDEDIQLRSELVTDEKKREGYLNYYSFHYNMAAQLSALIDSAIIASEQIDAFMQANQALIKGLKINKKNIENPRAELLLAVLTLQNISEIESAAISTILNNANMAIARLTYNENIITEFTKAAQEYIAKNRDENLQMLIDVHDKMAMLQFAKAVITKDKPMLKYYDKHEIFSDAEQLKVHSTEALNEIIFHDSENLQGQLCSQNKLEGSELLKNGQLLFSNENETLNSTKDFLNSCMLDFEKLGVYSNSVLNSQLNGNFDSEQLQSIMDSEQLQLIHNLENLGSGAGSF